MSNSSVGSQRARQGLGARSPRTGWLRFSDGSRPGFTGALRQTGARALTTFYRRVEFMCYSLATAKIPVYRAAIDVEFGQLQSSQVDDYLRFRPDCSRSLIERRMADGNRCFTSWHHGRIIDACWSATGLVHVAYLDRYLSIPDGDVFSFDSFTLKAHRGHGVYMARNSFQARHDRAIGLQRSIALVARENHAAILILSRCGLRTLGTYHHLRAPVRGICWATPVHGESLPRLFSRRDEAHGAQFHVEPANDA